MAVVCQKKLASLTLLPTLNKRHDLTPGHRIIPASFKDLAKWIVYLRLRGDVWPCAVEIIALRKCERSDTKCEREAYYDGCDPNHGLFLTFVFNRHS